MDQKYFATLPVKEIGAALLEKKDEYYQYLEDCGRAGLVRRAHEMYHRADIDGGKLYRSGVQGEYVNLCVNHFRNLLQHRITMTTSQRPAFEPKAINTDSESQRQVALSVNLLEYYERVKKMERFTNRATEFGVVYGEGFVGAFWNPTIGERKQGQPEGDLDFETFTGFDVIRPFGIHNDTINMPDWIILRRYKNKFTLAAKHPELADRIVDYQDSAEERRWHLNFDTYNTVRQDSDEKIVYYTFLHRKTEALPNGRIVEFTADDIVYADGPLPYNDIPVFRIAPNEQEGLIFGYTSSFDLMSMQEALDKLDSTIITNQAAFGVQSIAIPKGSGINTISLSSGLTIVEYDAKLGKPEPLQLTATPGEIFKFREDLKRDMETIVGVNSVARGNPEANLKSGAALALVQSLAIQFAQGLQQSYAMLLEDIGTAVIQILQVYADTERVVLIAGKNNRSNLRAFKGADLNLISRVYVDMGNPLTRTTAGRVNLAEQLVQNQLIETPQQYIEVLTSGRVEPIYEGERAELLLIRGENEQLQDGIPQQVIATDNHALHIQEHKCVLASPEVRSNPEIVSAVLDHISQHQMFIQPMQPQPAGNIENSGAVAESLDATNPVSQQAQSVNLPNMPTNPLTGQREGNQ